MEWGMANRLSRTIKSDGRCFYLAVDHGYFQGHTHESTAKRSSNTKDTKVNR